MVCTDTDGGQGDFWRTLSAIDLAHQAGLREHVLLTITDNVLTCGVSGNFERIVPIQKAVFTEVTFDSALAVLGAKVEFGRRNITEDAARKCEDARSKKSKVFAPLAPATKIHNLSYDFDGKQFYIKPESRKDEALVTSNPP